MARPRRELTGQRFGRLVVLNLLSTRKANGLVPWRCQCDCGNIVAVVAGNLRDNGRGTRSCGCLSRAISKAPNAQRKAMAARLKARTKAQAARL